MRLILRANVLCQCHVQQPHVPGLIQVTLVGLWLFPTIISFQLGFWRFCLVWAAYTGVVGYLLSLCVSRRHIDRITPKLVRGAHGHASTLQWFLPSAVNCALTGLTAMTM
jgi:hypothetical protein